MCHQVWLQQRRLSGTCQFHSFRGVCRDTILCRLVFVGDLWRHKKEHLVLALLRNGDFWASWLVVPCVRFGFAGSLMTIILSSTCFAAPFWLPDKVFGISFWISSQSYVPKTQLTAFISSPPANKKRKKPLQSPLQWFRIVNTELAIFKQCIFFGLRELSCGIWTVSFSLPNQVHSFSSKYLSGLGELVIPKNVYKTSFFMQVALKTSSEAA